jgi:Xaa-Pro aminopeptidase
VSSTPLELTDAQRAASAARRTRALERLGPNGALILVASPEPRAGADTELRYLADSSLYYLSGCEDPEAVLVLRGLPEAPSYILFLRGRDPERELWTGPRTELEEAREAFGADVAYPLPDLESRLPGLLEHADGLHYRLGASPVLDRLVLRALSVARAGRPRSGRGPHTITDPGRVLDPLRLLKDEHEIARIRHACELAVAAFLELRDVVRTGVGEWEIEASLEAGFRTRGASGPAFPTIVGSGANATVLHYVDNHSVVGKGDVVLVDGGARAGMYCSDLTRCYPADGRFSPAQRALYEVVSRAHAAGIAAARPGAPVSAIHDSALRVLVEGMVELRLLSGDPDVLLTQPETFKRFYPHRTSHWLGLDVHDVGDYVAGGEPQLLQPGMVLTVEPGLYLPAADEASPPELRGTGIRLEDDVLITATGAEVLSARLPLDPDALFG